jgi:hypothetical protein
MSTAFLQGLVRRLYAEESISAAYLGSDLAQPSPEAIEQIDLYLAAAPGFREAMAAWLAPVGEVAYSGPDGEGWRVVTPDGVEWRFHFALPPPSAGLQPLFDRRAPAEAGAGPSPAIDLAQMAGRFWADLYRAARALGKEQPFTAHGHLEECRRALLNLYRLALAPGEEGQGWEGLESLPGVAPALEQVREWLVAPLDLRVQWRAAHRLAAAYESLMLPLCQRLGVAYPMKMRNLAFGRLDQARPGRGPEGEAPRPAEPASEPSAPAPAGRLRVAKGRIRRG